MKKSLLALTVIVLFLSFGFSGCDDTKHPTADETAQRQQEQLTSESNRQSGMPNITNFTLKKQLKMIMEECDKEKLICYVYSYSEMTGKFRFISRCIGYGVPYAAQYTNPAQVVNRQASGSGYAQHVIPQADPTGLFMPASADATWILFIDDKNEIHPGYVEPKMTIVPFKFPDNIIAKD